MTQGTPIEGQDLLEYSCQCGFHTPDKGTFTKHLLMGSRQDGKGVHKSQGRVNTQTGEIAMPPFDQRSQDQVRSSRYALKKKGIPDGTGAIRQTEIIMDASQIKFVPRVLTCSFTPIMQSALAAAQRVWGFRSDMPFDNFLDTILVNFFHDRDIELASFVINNPALHEAARKQNIVAQTPVEVKEEVHVS